MEGTYKDLGAETQQPEPQLSEQAAADPQHEHPTSVMPSPKFQATKQAQLPEDLNDLMDDVELPAASALSLSVQPRKPSRLKRMSAAAPAPVPASPTRPAKKSRVVVRWGCMLQSLAMHTDSF